MTNAEATLVHTLLLSVRWVLEKIMLKSTSAFSHKYSLPSHNILVLLLLVEHLSQFARFC